MDLPVPVVGDEVGDGDAVLGAVVQVGDGVVVVPTRVVVVVRVVVWAAPGRVVVVVIIAGSGVVPGVNRAAVQRLELAVPAADQGGRREGGAEKQVERKSMHGASEHGVPAGRGRTRNKM